MFIINNISKDGYFNNNKIDCVTSVYPSTTTAALTSYYSGKSPYETGWIAWSQYFKEYGRQFYMDLGLDASRLRFHDHEKLAHYAKAACDIEYEFPFGWGEINGTHNRTNFDLTQHQQYSGVKQEYLDPTTNEKFVPYVIESTYGLDRTVLAILFEAYEEQQLEKDTRVVMHFSPYLAPYKACVLPLSKQLKEGAEELFDTLSKYTEEINCNHIFIGSFHNGSNSLMGIPYIKFNLI